jgi:hypothetical protein
MKFSLKEILDLDFCLPMLMNKDFGFNTCYKLGFLKNRLSEPMEFFRQKRNKLVQEYAEKDVKGTIKLNKEDNSPLFAEENKTIFMQKISELLSTEIDIDIKTFKLQDFENAVIKTEELSPVFIDRLIVED